MRRAALVAAIATLALPAPALAVETSRADFVSLAREASSDTASLDALRQVTSVDGVPIDVEAALAGAEGDALAGRLEQLAASAEESPPSGLDAAEARERVEAILASDPEPPEPASGGSDGPAIPFELAVLIAILIAVLAALTARGLGRQSVFEREAAEGGGDAEDGSSRNLSREADDAEKRGDFAAAVRLRFQAGLVRLDELGTVRMRPSLTAATAARESGIPAVGSLATTYERVAFGGRDATADDAGLQRSGWSEVIGEAKKRR